MDRSDLTATSWVTTRLTAIVLAAFGLFFLFRPDALGWGALVRWLGSEERVLAAGVGVGFLVLAALSLEKNALRLRVAELMEGLNQLLYGKDFARDREAIELLLRALEGKDATARETAHKHLVRLTGQHFAPDPLVWRAWWTANVKTWTARAATRGGGDDPAAAEPGKP